MPAKRLSSFTLMELTVSLFISAFLIGVAYFLLQSFGQYFQLLDQNKIQVSETQMLRTQLREHLEDADSIIVREARSFVFYTYPDSLIWQSTHDSIVLMKGQKQYTFPLKYARLSATAQNSKAWVTRLELSFSNREDEVMVFRKEYPVTKLLR